MSLITYMSFESLFQRRSGLDEFIELLSKFTAESLLWNCAALNFGLRVWDASQKRISDQEPALDAYFTLSIAAEIRRRLWSRNREVLLHRRQILLLQKLALVHGKNDGMHVNQHPNAFGILLLMANDHLHNPNPFPKSKVETAEDYVHLMSDLLPISESGDEEIGTSFIRTKTILEKLTQARKGERVWFDAAGEFEQQTGLTYEELDCFLLGLLSYVNARTLDEIWKNPSMVYVTHLQFSKTEFSTSKLLKLFDFCSSSRSQIKDDILKRDYGFNDLTALRSRPVLRRWWNVGSRNQWSGELILDPIFLSYKALTAPYWIASRKYGDKFRSFWGTLFEDYMNQFMKVLCSGTHMTYTPDLRASDGKQICDGMLVQGDAAILFEYKSFMLSAEAKYSNVPSVLQEAIHRNFVENARGKPKGVRQLSAAVETLFERNSDTNRPKAALGVRTVFPCIVTLDSIGGAIGINGYLQMHWKVLRTIDADVRPICCIPIDTLEKKSGEIRKHSFVTILNKWMQLNPAMGTPLSQMELGLIGRAAIHEMDTQMQEYFERSVKRLFADESADGPPT